ncbi:MAG: hypothetical protein WKF58_13260 [Ilumatobacteraceae bacterium]
MIGGLTYNFLPFMILPIYVSLEKINPALVDAAKDLLLDRPRRVPQSRRAVVAARRVRRDAADIHSGRWEISSTPSTSATRTRR